MSYISTLIPELVSSLIAVIIVLFVIFLTMRMRRKIRKYGVYIIILASVGGIFIYTSCYSPSDIWSKDGVVAILRGIFSAASMFASGNDYSTLTGPNGQKTFLSNSLCQIFFWFCHVLAAFVAIYVLVGFFGKEFTNRLHIKWNTCLFGKNKDHYILIGCGKSIRLFLNDWEKNATKIPMTSITIITGELDDDGSVYKSFVEDGLATIKGRADSNTLKIAGAFKLKHNTKVVAISESDEENLNVAHTITKEIDSKLSNKKIEWDGIKLEAHIMYSSIKRTEFFNFARDVYPKVRFSNPYEMQARYFFNDNPITKFIGDLIDTNLARLKGKFDGIKITKENGREYCIKNIFVGFGPANYQMLNNSVMAGQLLGCDYNAIIYDENIHKEASSAQQAIFMNRSRGLFFDWAETLKKGKEYLESPKEMYNIRFKNGDVLTKSFYDNLIREIFLDGHFLAIKNDFTAIYVALGDEMLSVETAYEIRQHLYEYDITSNKDVRIFVGARKNSIYSQILAPKDGNSKNNIEIEYFGHENEILTKENFIDDKRGKFAREISKGYDNKCKARIYRSNKRHEAMLIPVKLGLLGFELMDGGNNTEVEEDIYFEKYAGKYEYEVKKFNGYRERITQIKEEEEKILKYYIPNPVHKKSGEINSNIDDEISKIMKQKLREIKREKLILEKIRKDYIETCVRKKNGEVEIDVGDKIDDTPRNNLALLELVRMNTFRFVEGWTKMSVDKIGIGSENPVRKDEIRRQYAGITTFKTRNQKHIRDALSEATVAENNNGPDALDVDLVWCHYTQMDEIFRYLEDSGKKISFPNKVQG